MVENNFLRARVKRIKLNRRSRGVSNSDISTSSTESSSSLINFSASFSRRDSGESNRRIPVTSSIGSELRDGSVKEFEALAI